MDPWRLILARHVLWEGGVIAYPTEAVWGLGCLPDNLESVLRILRMKQRALHQGLILVAADADQFGAYLEHLSAPLLRRLDAHWPGPVTFLVEHGGLAPEWITGGRDTVALRVSDHPVVRDLCRACASPIVSTSANPGGRAPARDALRVRSYFHDEIDLFYPGELGGSSRVSEIRDLATDRIVRAG